MVPLNTNNKYEPYTAQVDAESVHNVDTYGAARDADGKVVGIEVGDAILKGFGTPRGGWEFFSPTIHDWGWPEQQYTIPWPLKSHVHPSNIDRTQGEMLLLPNLPPTLSTRGRPTANGFMKFHKNPIWMHPEDAQYWGGYG